MKQSDVKLGGIYETKIGEHLAWVEVVSVAPYQVPYIGAVSNRTKFMIRRVFDDGSKGPILSKRRSAAALRPRQFEIAIYEAQKREDARAKVAGEKPRLISTECKTCLGVGKLRDGDTNDLRKCLDCRGEGVS